MNLSAVSIGHGVPGEDFSASVHSVFESAINLQVHNSDWLLTLHASSEADLPQGIRLDSPKDFSFERFSVGEKCICRERILKLGAVTIDLRSARCWKCDLPALRADITNLAISTAWSLVWEALVERQRLNQSEIRAADLFRPDGVKPLGVAGRACGALRDLLDSTRRRQPVNTDAVKALIGLGSGLTPAGDDVLVGFLAGLWCTVRDKAGRAPFISSLGKTILLFSKETNAISRTYLYHAVQGQVSSRLADLAEAISHGETPERLLDTSEAAMQVGHTSGMDAVTGLLAGLTAWEDQVPIWKV